MAPGRAILEMVGGLIVVLVSLLVIRRIESTADEIQLFWYFIPFLGGFATLFGLHRLVTGSRAGMEIPEA